MISAYIFIQHTFKDTFSTMILTLLIYSSACYWSFPVCNHSALLQLINLINRLRIPSWLFRMLCLFFLSWSHFLIMAHVNVMSTWLDSYVSCWSRPLSHFTAGDFLRFQSDSKWQTDTCTCIHSQTQRVYQPFKWEILKAQNPLPWQMLPP